MWANILTEVTIAVRYDPGFEPAVAVRVVFVQLVQEVTSSAAGGLQSTQSKAEFDTY